MPIGRYPIADLIIGATLEDTVNVTTYNIFAVAPGEGHKLISILNDQHFKEMCNPTKYPTGKFGLIAER